MFCIALIETKQGCLKCNGLKEIMIWTKLYVFDYFCGVNVSGIGGVKGSQAGILMVPGT